MKKTFTSSICFCLLAIFTLANVNAQTDSTKTPPPHNIGVDFKIGAGLVRNQFAPTLDFRMFYTNRENFKIQLAHQNYFFFEREPNRNFDMFTHSLVSLTFLKYKEKNTWAGVSLGYMIARRGDYFKGTSFKLGFPVEVEKKYFSAFNLIITPEVWFTNDFKSVFPGITIKF